MHPHTFRDTITIVNRVRPQGTRPTMHPLIQLLLKTIFLVSLGTYVLIYFGVFS